MAQGDAFNYVPTPPDSERNERLSRLKLRPGDVTTMPLTVKSGQHFVFAAHNPLARNWLKPFPEISTLEELKNFVGVPDSAFKNSATPPSLPYPDVHYSSLEASDANELLDRNSTAYKVGVNLVYGPTPPDATSHLGVNYLVAAMAGTLKGQYLVVGKDLIVQAGASIDLGTNPTVTFDRIIIHGDGAIFVHDHQKVIAGAIQWLPS